MLFNSLQHMDLTLPFVASSIILASAIASANNVPGYVGFDDVHRMPFGRSDMTVTVVNASEGTRMYLIGGCDTDQICYGTGACFCNGLTSKTQYYRVQEDRYTTSLSDAPRNRYRHAAAALNGVIYLFGGRDVADNMITEVDAYDIATDTWSTPCNWTDATSDLTAFELPDENGVLQIFVVAGYTPTYSPTNATRRFNPATCTFTNVADMPYARGDTVSIVAGTSRKFGIVVGGFSVDWCNGHSTSASYDAVTDVWTELADLQLGRADLALGIISNHVFAIAGETSNADCSLSVPVTDVERLESQPDGSFEANWTVEQSIPSSRFRFVGASHGRAIFLFGGQGSYVENLDGQGNGGYPVLNTTMVYHPDITTFDLGGSGAAKHAGSIATMLVATLAATAAPLVIMFLTEVF